MPETLPDYDTIVIGAGAAGLSATKHLMEAGQTVLCLEAADRIGGRVWTDTEIFGVPFDVGAHWLHSEEVNPFIEIGKSLGLTLYPQGENYLTHGDPDDAMWAESLAIGDLMEAAAEEAVDRSMLDVFQTKGRWSHTAALTHALSMGRDMAEISVKDWDLYAEGEDWFCAEGFGTLVARYAGELPVMLNVPVTGVIRTPAGVTVETSRGSLSASAVIVTVSVGVLRAGDIRFDPPLENDLLSALNAVTMGTYNHCALQLAPGTLPVKPDCWLTYEIAPDPDHILRGGGFLCDASGMGLTVFESAGTFAQELEEAGEDAAIAFAMDRLVEIFGTNVRKGLIKGHAMQWGRNPFTQGSYSGALPGGWDRRQHIRAPHEGVIHFAGEATHPEEMATVSGAHKEGLRAAKTVLKA